MKLRRRSLALALAGTLVGTTFVMLAWSAAPAVGASSGPAGGVNVEPSMRPWRYVGANPQSWWCQPPNCTSDFANPVATATNEMQQAKALGAQNIRLEIPWPVIETSSGVYDWSRADAIFQAASQVGITIEPILMWTPQWAGGGALLTDPPSAAEMQAFAQAFAQRYDPVIRRGVEIWNEEDGGKYFTGSAATYVSQILNPAYTGIKSVDSSIPVILGGTGSDTDGSFLQAVISAGGHFDIAAFHNYSGSEITQAQSYQTILDSAGRSGTPIWLGEYGSESGTSSQVTLIQQVLGQSSPIAMAQWYNLRDTDSWECCPAVDVDAGTWGLLTSGFSQKSSYTTMQGYLTGRTAAPPPAWSAPATPTPPPPTPTPDSSHSPTSSTPAPSSPAPKSPTPGSSAAGSSAPSSSAPSSSAKSSPAPSSAAASAHGPSSSPAAGPSGGPGQPSPSAAALATPGHGSTQPPGGGMPWAPFAAAGVVLVLLAVGAAVWAVPGLRRVLPFK